MTRNTHLRSVTMELIIKLLILFAVGYSIDARGSSKGGLGKESRFLRHDVDMLWEEEEAFIMRQLESSMSIDVTSPPNSPLEPGSSPPDSPLEPGSTPPDSPTEPGSTLSPTLSSPPSPTLSPVTLLPKPTSINLEWFGQNAYFSAKNVKATIDDGGMITFQDDFARPLDINSGGSGEEISREDAWREGGIERRVKFYFNINPPGDPFSTHIPDAAKFGWYMYDARMYNAEGTGWVYWGGDYQNVSMVQTRPGYAMFHCDYFELDYVLDSWSGQEEPGGKFEAENVTIGGYLEEGYDVSSLRVFNPCMESFPGEDCRAVNGKVFCGDTPLTMIDFN